MKPFRFIGVVVLIAMLPAAANAEVVDRRMIERFADEILRGLPDEARRVAVQPFATEESPIPVDLANEFNAALLSALIRRNSQGHVFVARGALKFLVREVAGTPATPRTPDDPVETLLRNATADVLVIGALRRSDPGVTLSYKAVAVTDGAVLASTPPQRIRLRRDEAALPGAVLGLDQALTAAAKYLADRVDSLEALHIGEIRYRGAPTATAFAAYVRDRMTDEFRRRTTGILTGARLRVVPDSEDKPQNDGAYRLVGNYWPLGRSVDLSLSLWDADGVAVTWRDRVRTDTIPATLALSPVATPKPPSNSRRVAIRSREPLAVPVRGRETVAETQRLLFARGYDPGPANGVLGPDTRQAIVAFQHGAGLASDGRMTRALAKSLRSQGR